MKILIIIGSFGIGGAERMSITIGEELSKRGYDVYYIVQRPVFELPNKICPEKIVVLRKKSYNNYFYKASSLFLGTFKTAKKIKPDVVIGFSRFSSFLANFTCNRRIIATFDAYPYRMNLKQKIWADLILFSPLIKNVILPSSGMVQALRDIRPLFYNKYYYIPNTVNSFEIKTKSLEKERVMDFEYIVSMGRFSPQKNFELLIKAFAESRIKNKYKLIIIGDGDHRPVLETLIIKLNLQKQVLLTGGLSNPFPLIKASKFFVDPSHLESFGNVILEALCLGKPVIATDCNYGPADMIINGKNGFLVRDNNLMDMVEKLDQLGLDDDLIKEMGDNASSSVEKFFIDPVTDKWENLLTKMGGVNKAL